MARCFASCISLLFCIVLLAGASPAFAQSLGELEAMQPPVAGQDARQAADDDIQIIRVTDRLAQRPESIAALRAYHKAKALGLLPTFKTAVSYDVGQEKDFNVITDIYTDDARWETRAFTLVAQNDIANMWIANDQLGVATDEQIEEIEAYVLSRTPEGSWRPEEGIIANSHHIFGDPPIEPNADGKADILFFDIVEGTDDCCVLGFVTAIDLDPEPDEPGVGNMGNIVYMDLPQGIGSRGGVLAIAGTLAHEYQHVIHNAYQHVNFKGPCSTCELTFVNEGLSEWSELLHGFPPRPIRYLDDLEEHGRPLLSWRRDSGTAATIRDYERSGLFTTYIADRIGAEPTGSIVRAKCPPGAAFCPIGSWLNGADAYDQVLGEHGFTLARVVADFHAANFINDAGVGEQYAYKPSIRHDVKAPSTMIVDTEADPAPSETTVNLTGGAVEYLTWENATDLVLEIKDFENPAGGGPGGGFRVGSDADANNRKHLSLRLFTETEAGAKELASLPADTESYSVKGTYERVTLIVVHTQANFFAPIKLDITGNWGGERFDVTTVAYETGNNQDKIYLSGDEEDIMAQAYPVPDGAQLTTVFVAPVYDNQYSNRTAPLGAPRDFTLKVWDVEWRDVPYEFDDATDPPTPLRSWRLAFPRKEIYSQDVDESPTASHLAVSSDTYSFLRVDLPQDEQALATLPDSIFIGLANKGVDNNYLSLTMARGASYSDPDTLAYWYGTLENRDGEDVTAWRPMAALRLCRNPNDTTYECDRDDDDDFWFSLAGQVWPIRARFRASLGVTSAEEDPVELPSGVTLAQNYPNPFNPTTSIAWTQPASAQIRLSVYNLLGQKMAMPVDGLRPAGEHEVRLDASGWASGVYVYVLETGAHIATRRMVLMK